MSRSAATVASARRVAGLPRATSPRLQVSDGSIEALKWIGLLCMTVDHVNRYMLNGSSSAMFAVGRLTLPLFSFVLAYNLARPSTLANAEAVFSRTLIRLICAGVIATPPFMALGGLAGGWWPANIMATFAVAVAVMQLLLHPSPARKFAAALVILIGGGLVEFWWPALGMTLGAWYFCQRPSAGALAVWIASTAALALDGWAFAAQPLANAWLWALPALPLIFAAARWRISIGRAQWLFYAYYPLHLAVIWLFRSL